MRRKEKRERKKAQLSSVIIFGLLVVMNSSQNFSLPLSPVNNSSTPPNPPSTFPSATPFLTTLNISAPSIVSFEPKSIMICDVEGGKRTFSISTDQIVDVQWFINGTEIQVNKSVINASYTKSATVGIWNVSAIAFNKNGTIMHTWIWKVSQNFSNFTTPTPTPTPTKTPQAHSSCETPSPSPSAQSKPIIQKKTHTCSNTSNTTAPFYIFGWVNYTNGEKCYNPTVIVSKGGKKWHAETTPDSNFFHLFITNISEGDDILINVSDGNQHNSTNFVVTHEDMERGGIFNVNLTLKSPTQTDLAVTRLFIEQPEIIGDAVNVTAVVENKGKSANATTIFYDEKNISIFRYLPNFTSSENDIIVQPEALKIRIHFIELGIQAEL